MITSHNKVVEVTLPLELQAAHLMRETRLAVVQSNPLLSLPSLNAESSSSSSSSDLSKSEAASTKEEDYAWAGYEDDVIPNKQQAKLLRNLRHQIFTLYRRLFGIVFIVNMSIFVVILCRGANAAKIGEIAIANLCCAILMRQDYVINAFFNVFCAVPQS